MIDFKNLRQYTQKTQEIKFSRDSRDGPYLMVYFSENSSFLADLPKLNLRYIDFRHVIVPTTSIPRTRITPQDIKNFKAHKFHALSSNQKVPVNKNIVFDMSAYMNKLDLQFKPSTYRQRAGSLLQNMVLKAFSSYPNNYKKIFLYSVDTEKPYPKFISRKIFPMLLQLKEGIMPYDHMLYNMIGSDTSMYRMLIKDKSYNFQRIRNYLMSSKFKATEDEMEELTNKASEKVIDKVSKNIPSKNKEKIKGAVKKYLNTDEEMSERIEANQVDDKEMSQIATASILASTSGDVKKAERISKGIPDNSKAAVLKSVSKTLSDDLLTPKKPVSTSTDITTNQYDIFKVNDNNSPDHIFEKRQIDFETNLTKDLTNSFNVLKNREIPIEVKSMKVVDKKTKAGELKKSDVAIVEVILKDKFGNEHNIKIEIPKIGKDGTFTINGRKKCLINQIVLLPISFPKPFDSKFESSYSTFHITSKRTKREEYLEVYMGSYRIPLMILLSYGWGFFETLKQYGIKYEITDVKPPKTIKWTSKIGDNQYIVFNNVNTKLKEELCQSFKKANVTQYEVRKEFGTKEYFNDIIIEMTGRINSTFLIQSNIENIVDPIAKQVLVNKQLPFDLPAIMKYMASKVVEGYVESRNDLGAQRIRNSEVIVHLAQKQILAAYTEYKEQVLSGNEEADFTIPHTKILSDFINSQIVVDMEYANPVEEMATLTRVSPVGKNIGGIPDKNAIQQEARNVHDSYFGNIDPLDTPEGDNVGIVQHLTIDALITSARGIFNEKEISDLEHSGVLSTTAALIPFIENNDGNRVMFGCNQSRQSVPLKNPEPPIVKSGFESVLTNVLSDNYIRRSPCNGKVLKIADDFIAIQCSGNKRQDVDITPVHLRSGSGKDTLSVFNVIVKEGQTVKTKQVVAEGSCVAQGSIALGRSLLTAVMPYKGFNFEDGIVVSESLVKSGKMTSLHGIEVDILISEKDRVVFINNNIGQITTKGEILVRKTVGEIEELIGFEEEEESEEISGGQLLKKSPGGKIVDIEVFSNIKEDKFPDLKNLIDRTNKRYKKPPAEKFSIKGETIKGVLIRFKIEQELSLGIGDKLTNRHGAKGIISLIEKDENMPRTPDGDKVEIIVNPLGITSRMNMGQVYELYSGLIGVEIGKRILQLKDKTKVITFLNKILPEMDTTDKKIVSGGFIKSLKNLSPNKYKEFLKQIEKNKSFPILIPPFKGPNHIHIIKTLKLLGLKTGYKLKLPEYNTSTFNEVPIGYKYFLKLEHIGREKLHGRSTGPVTGKTMQPTAGKAHEGGQRMGELDTYSFISYNALHVLAESFGPLSDDHMSKNELISDIVQTGSAEYRDTKHSPVKDLLNFYFISLMLERK